jgi:hypothetical protein
VHGRLLAVPVVPSEVVGHTLEYILPAR